MPTLRDIKELLVDVADRHTIAVPAPHGVEAYILIHKLAPLVVRACQESRLEFPLPTELSLELYKDPEIDDQHLVVYVRPIKYGDQACKDLIARTHKVSAILQPFMTGRVNGWLHVTSDGRTSTLDS